MSFDTTEQQTTEQRFPLTKQQQGLWIEWKLHPENTSYNTCVKVKLKGDINVEQLGQALFDIVQYFDSLKVYFVEDSGIPFQCIKNKGIHFLNYQDISIPGQEETAELERQGLDFLSKTLNTPIDLKTFPIVRAALMKVADETFYFIGMVPHMISDGRSAVLFLESLSIAYNGGYEGLKQAYDATTKSWADYHDDPRTQFNVEQHSRAKDHWQQRLLNANHYFDYSYGRSNSKADSKQGHRVYFDIPNELAKGLKAHTSKNKTTLFNVMVCAFGIFIHRYFSRNDILIGFPISIRPPGYKHLFGFFVNIVPIRVDLSGDPSYQELLARVSANRKQDKRFQKFPALDIVNAVRENVDDFDGQLFNLSMAQTVSRLYNLELEGVVTQALESEYNDVNDDLSLSYELLDDGIGLWFEYRTSMFDQEFISQGIEHIQQILEQMVSTPELHLSEFKLLSNEQRLELESFSNRLSHTVPETNKSFKNHTLVTLLQNAELNFSNSVAVEDATNKISYQQLAQRSNQLAHFIQEKIIQQQNSQQNSINLNQPIAICLNRSVDLIVTLIAVLKSGCHYIPIAPNYPNQRLAYVLDETQCQLIICEDATQELCYQMSTPLFNINEAAESINEMSQEDLLIDIDPEDKAYIIFTSGSTGKPKGVPISHANLVPKLTCLQQEIVLNESDSMLQNTDFSFDVSVAEIFWPLISGASLIVSQQDQGKNPNELLQLISQHSITTSCMVPSLLNALLLEAERSNGVEKLHSIKYMLAAGEVLSPNLIQRFQHQQDAILYNFYGPTEAAIYATFYQCDCNENLSACPIGRPLDYSSAYILDHSLKLQAKGVAGELYLAGPSISSGYLNRADLNKNAFVKNPYSQTSERMYRTGDLARYLPDGNIDFLGRIDQQVKIRGYRIEIGEIEIALSMIESISDSAVVVDQEAERLVAFYTLSTKIEANVINDEGINDEIKIRLASTLPSYMIPTLLIKIDSIPRSESGKILYKNLPSVSDSVVQKAQYAPAETSIEKHLVRIWSQLLKIPEDKIGIYDSFFELGGDSLMAIQFASVAAEQSLQIDTIALFDSRSISEIAKIAKVDKPSDEQLSSSIEGQYFLTARQYKFFNDGFVNSNYWNRSFYFDVIKKIKVSALEKAFTQVLNQHDALRVSFTKTSESNWVQNNCSTKELQSCVKHIVLSHLSESEQNTTIKRMVIDEHKAIRLDQSPLIRAVYFELSKNTGTLAILSHHLLLDMVSSRIIFEDLIHCYEYARRGLNYKFPTKTTSLKRWTDYLQNYARENDFSEALSYWGNLPHSHTPAIPLDSPFEIDKNTESNAKTITVKLATATTENLLKNVPSLTGFKIQDLLLIALHMLMKDWTNESSIVVNTCGHGRNSNVADINLSRTVGWLNTVYPVKINSSNIDNLTGFDLIQALVEQISTVPAINMDYNILRYIQKNPEITKNDEPQLFFNYVGQIDAIIPDKIAFIPKSGIPSIADIDGENHLCYHLYFEAGVIANQLNIRLTYNQVLFKSSTIDYLLKNLLTNITDVTDTLMSTKI